MKRHHKILALLAGLAMMGIGAVSYSTSTNVHDFKFTSNGLIANIRGGNSLSVTPTSSGIIPVTDTTMSTTQHTNLTITLSPGVWLVTGQVVFDCLTSNSIDKAAITASISETAASLDTSSRSGLGITSTGSGEGLTKDDYLPLVPRFFVVPKGQTKILYLVTLVTNVCSGGNISSSGSFLLPIKLSDVPN